ncbi:glutamate receptor ionotropic, kainate 3-like isoform X2 [Tigriopus californicus]|uniref:glutamate receptor ionotropic, kainate 3-like isoform X2 n=1 Tax=Tigriopus californicus TaxID=6832 RepID=UPI0027DA5FA2|nr:glutamate receptor ionotropic, kainate 3-like isoform X2 [Tigriopus californicus]
MAWLERWIHLYCPNHGWQFNVTLFGGPENKQLRPIPKCPTSLANQHFNISSIGFSPPDVVFNDEGEIVGGTALDVFNIMAEKYHFNYTIKTEFAWGQPIGENGEWNGLIGNVKNGTSAFGVGIIFMDYDYSKAVDYLDTLVFYPIILRSKKPSKLPAYSNLLRPFSLLVWLMILAFVPAFVIVFITFKHSEGVTKGSELASHGFMVVRILFGQSGKLTTHNERSSKIFVGFWIMIVLFLSSMYECNLRAYLMHTSYEKPIETEKDILDRGRDLYLPVRTPFDAYYRDSELDLRRQLWAKVEKNPNLLFYSGIASCVLQHEETNLLEKGGVDLLSPVIFFARYPIMKEKFGYEPFYISKKAVFELQFSMMLKKHQDHRQDLNWVVRQLQAAGIVDHLSRNYLSQEAVFGESLDNRPKAFTFEHFAGAFVILTIGLILGFCMFLYESLSTKE